jgi:azurin
MFAKLVAVSLLTLASSQLMAAECKVTVDSTDQMSFDTKEISIDKSCKTFTVELKHSGSLPKNVMGHNWVLSKTADMQPIATDGLSAGIEKNYLKEGDARIIAHTKIDWCWRNGFGDLRHLETGCWRKLRFLLLVPGPHLDDERHCCPEVIESNA